MNDSRTPLVLLAVQFLFLVLLFIWALSLGPAELSFFKPWATWSETEILILTEARLPRLLTAIFASSLLGVSGLFMQSYFQNPLVGPYILGVQNGAALSVALFTLLGVSFSQTLELGLWSSAAVGALLVLGVLLFFASFMRQKVMLLIVGLLLGQLCSGLVSLLAVMADAERLKAFVLWGLGSFERLTFSQLPEFITVSFILLLLSFFLIKPLDLMLLGESYAKSLGLHLQRAKILFLLLAGLMAALVTATCGPIAFLGLLAPHLTRLIYRTQKHLWLLPGTILTSALLGIFVQALVLQFSQHQLPINVALGLVCAPIMLAFLLKLKGRAHVL